MPDFSPHRGEIWRCSYNVRRDTLPEAPFYCQIERAPVSRLDPLAWVIILCPQYIHYPVDSYYEGCMQWVVIPQEYFISLGFRYVEDGIHTESRSDFILALAKERAPTLEHISVLHDKYGHSDWVYNHICRGDRDFLRATRTFPSGDVLIVEVLLPSPPTAVLPAATTVTVWEHLMKEG